MSIEYTPTNTPMTQALSFQLDTLYFASQVFFMCKRNSSSSLNTAKRDTGFLWTCL